MDSHFRGNDRDVGTMHRAHMGTKTIDLAINLVSSLK